MTNRVAAVKVPPNLFSTLAIWLAEALRVARKRADSGSNIHMKGNSISGRTPPASSTDCQP
ncbi:hypothetical protein D9M71_737550 [compost metagenome]